MTDKTCIFCDEIYYQGVKVDSLGLCECEEEGNPVPELVELFKRKSQIPEESTD